MKVYSDKLELRDLYAATSGIPDVYAEAATIKRPRVRSRGWIVRLEADRQNGRNRNSGTHGAETWTGVKAATYQEHGYWMARLFELDPNAKVAQYDGREDFEAETRKAADWGPHYAAPWLDAYAERIRSNDEFAAKAAEAYRTGC